jgi:hypothetical protein
MKILELNNAKALAKIEAQKTGKDQIIFPTYYGRQKGFRFLPVGKWNGTPTAIVRYSPEDEHRDVLRNNGNRKPRTAKSKPKGKGKPGNAE